MAVDIDEIIQRLNELWAWKQGVEANSKNISQLPPATDGNKLVAAYNETSLDTEQFSISEALAQFNAQNDRLTNLGAITRVDNEFTFEVGFEGIINGLTYGNTVAIPREINVATDTFFRIDIAVLDNSNNIVIIEGVESDVIGNQPPTPPNTLLICSFNIFGSVIGNPNTINNDTRIVKIINTTEIYPIVQSDSLKFLVLRSDFDVELPLLLQDNSLFVIKNDSGFSREITFDTDIEFLGSPIIPDGALCFLKKIETTVLGVEIYSVDSISGGASLNLQQVLNNGKTAELPYLEFIEITNDTFLNSKLYFNSEFVKVEDGADSLMMFSNGFARGNGITSVFISIEEPTGATGSGRIVFRDVADETKNVAWKEEITLKTLYLNTADSTPSTGTTAEVIHYTIPILANTIPANCVITITAKGEKNNDTGTFNLKLQKNTSASLSGATQLATCATGTSPNRIVPILRTFALKAGNLNCFPTTTSTSNDLGFANANPTLVPFDVSVDNYIMVTLTGSSGATLKMNYVEVILKY